MPTPLQFHFWIQKGPHIYNPENENDLMVEITLIEEYYDSYYSSNVINRHCIIRPYAKIIIGNRRDQYHPLKKGVNGTLEYIGLGTMMLFKYRKLYLDELEKELIDSFLQ